MPATILWVPAHPAEGSVSMDRYRKELERLARAGEFSGFSIRSALSGSPPQSARGGTFTRAAHKYALYPVRVWFKSRGARVVHLLDHSWAHLLPWLPRGATKIVTVHDLAPLRTGELKAGQLRRYKRAVAFLHRAHVVLADSTCTANDLTALLGIDPKCIRVLPLGVDASAFQATGVSGRSEIEPGRFPTPAILSIGGTGARKNLAILPAIMRGLRETFPHTSLIRVGPRLPGSLRAEIVSAIGAENLAELGPVPDGQLAAIYAAAAVLIFPSTYEGFGFPLLEAMAAGCPVVSSDATSLPEVGGDAVHYFSPGHPAEAVARIIEVLGDPQKRGGMIERGRNRARSFAWENHAARLTEIYRRALTPGVEV